MLNPEAFAAGFKQACDRFEILPGMLLKLSGARDPEADHGMPGHLHTAQRVANIAQGAPMEPVSPGLGEIISRLQTLGLYGAPGTTRQPFGS